MLSEVKIGVIGAGNIGGTIGTKWASQGRRRVNTQPPLPCLTGILFTLVTMAF